MKSKLITLAMLFVSVAWAGVVTVSDPGQAQGKLITTRDIVPFVNVALTASNTPDQTVYLTIKQNGIGSDIDLFVGSVSNKLTGMQTVLGPFVVKSGQTNDIVVSARVNSVKATTNSSPTVSLNLTAVSNSTPILVQGTFPIQGTPYIVDTNLEEVVHGRFTSIEIISGVPYVTGISYPLRIYDVQYSTNLNDWETHGSLLSGANGIFRAELLGVPSNSCCYFRLKSSVQ